VSNYSILNIFSVVWFFIAWLGYARFAKYKAKRGYHLSSVLNLQRLAWMEQLLKRDQRIMDAALVANLERNVSFLASTSILVLAGLLTALGVADSIDTMLQALPFYQTQADSMIWVQLKICLLLLIYVYAFFSLRQYGFASVMIGSAPSAIVSKNNPELAEKYSYASSKVIDMAGHAYNYGLRAYYFSLAVLAWFISPWFFMASSTLIVVVLYIRDFHSRPFRVIKDYMSYCDDQKQAKETGHSAD